MKKENAKAGDPQEELTKDQEMNDATEDQPENSPETSENTGTEFQNECQEDQTSGEMEKKCGELNDRYLRLMAEYDNFRKRSQKEREDLYPAATAAAVEKFLPVLDNLERAAAFPRPDDDFGKGFDMIYQSFKDVLTALKVEELGQVGELFDPSFHNAVMHIEDEALGENVVSQVLQKGYKIGDRIIRYAMVQTAN